MWDLTSETELFRRGAEGGGAATLESMRNIVCILNNKACKHILVEIPNYQIPKWALGKKTDNMGPLSGNDICITLTSEPFCLFGTLQSC